MEKSIFEKIANKEIPANIIDENEEFMAFLDQFPSIYGQTLVIPKKQRDSYVFKQDAEFMNRYWQYIQKIALRLDAKLGSIRTVLMFEGFEVNHLHAKLYPFLNMEEAIAFNPRSKGELSKDTAEEIMKRLS